MDKIKILCLSDSPPCNTGFSSQSLFLMNNLADRGYDIHFLAHNYTGQNIPPKGLTFEDGTTCNFWIHGTGNEPYGKDKLQILLRQIKPDIYYTLLDTFMLFPWYAQMDFSPAKLTWWFPSDGGGGLPKNCENLLKRVNLPVAMSRFAQKQVKDYYNLDVEYIPHAVNLDIFSPMNEQEKQINRANWGIPFNKFVVGTVYRNQPRKFADRQIKAFAKFAKDKDDVVLLNHTDPQDRAMAFDTIQLIRDLGIENKTAFTGMSWLQGFPYAKMKEVYNLFDIYLSSTSGEGFGICTVESMACKVPVIIPSYTTGDELVRHNKSGEVVKLSGCEDIDYFGVKAQDYDNLMQDGTILGSWHVERGVMSISDCRDKLEKLYKDWKENNSQLLKEYGENGRKAVLEKYTWKIVTDTWDKKLRAMVEK